MLQKLALILASINLIFVALLWPEIKSLPNIKNSMQISFGLSLSLSESIFILSFLIVISPIILCTIILTHFKKYVFNHAKPIVRSYFNIITLLSISYLFSTFFYFLDFLLKLAFRSSFYLKIRFISLFKEDYYGHLLFFNIMSMLLYQSATFVVCFLFGEMYIAKRLYHTQQTNVQFMKRNRSIMYFVGVNIIGYVAVIAIIEHNFFKKSKSQYRIAEGFVEKFHFGTIVNCISIYLYIVISLFGV